MAECQSIARAYVAGLGANALVSIRYDVVRASAKDGEFFFLFFFFFFFFFFWNPLLTNSQYINKIIMKYRRESRLCDD